MPLPKINTPTYELVLPSTGKKIKYRPFLVREEKILIMALESEDMKQITDAIVEILDACIITRGVKLSNLSTFDMEYLFLNVRGKSVGETIEVNLLCPDDEKTQVTAMIDIDFTFYIDENYTNLRIFEGWMDYISSGANVSQGQKGFYRRVQYPDSYKCDTMYITKFEKNYRRRLDYQFINAFPKSITSIPVSYGTAEILKVTVSFNYDRYIMDVGSINN